MANSVLPAFLAADKVSRFVVSGMSLLSTNVVDGIDVVVVDEVVTVAFVVVLLVVGLEVVVVVVVIVVSGFVGL